MTKTAQFDDLPPFLTKHQLAAVLQVPLRTVEGWRSRGKFSSEMERQALMGVRIGGKVRYSKAALLAYLDEALEMTGRSDSNDEEATN